jgi:hypothetical protein
MRAAHSAAIVYLPGHVYAYEFTESVKCYKGCIRARELISHLS